MSSQQHHPKAVGGKQMVLLVTFFEAFCLSSMEGEESSQPGEPFQWYPVHDLRPYTTKLQYTSLLPL